VRAAPAPVHRSAIVVFFLSYCCFAVLAREHTTCATMPGPRHRSNTTLSTSRLVASRPPARATIKGPTIVGCA
jgi:hypothetical protein